MFYHRATGSKEDNIITVSVETGAKANMYDLGSNQQLLIFLLELVNLYYVRKQCMDVWLLFPGKSLICLYSRFV